MKKPKVKWKMRIQWAKGEPHRHISFFAPPDMANKASEFGTLSDTGNGFYVLKVPRWYDFDDVLDYLRSFNGDDDDD